MQYYDIPSRYEIPSSAASITAVEENPALEGWGNKIVQIRAEESTNSRLEDDPNE